MPGDIVAKLHWEIATALRAPAVQAQFALLGVEPMTMNQEQFAKFFRDDVAANLELVKIAKIRTQ
jgi:tripartite-type tricarboxylate transporter receptor subunit TctC